MYKNKIYLSIYSIVFELFWKLEKGTILTSMLEDRSIHWLPLSLPHIKTCYLSSPYQTWLGTQRCEPCHYYQRLLVSSLLEFFESSGLKLGRTFLLRTHKLAQGEQLIDWATKTDWHTGLELGKPFLCQANSSFDIISCMEELIVTESSNCEHSFNHI